MHLPSNRKLWFVTAVVWCFGAFGCSDLDSNGESTGAHSTDPSAAVDAANAAVDASMDSGDSPIAEPDGNFTPIDGTVGDGNRPANDYIATTSIDLDDPYFAKQYVDIDESRDEPVPHRYIHGGFEGTDARFSMYFPAADKYEGRFFHYLMAIPGNENAVQNSEYPDPSYTISFAADSGGYLIESNHGSFDMYFLGDQTIPMYRTSAAVAKYSHYWASQIYGTDTRPYGYVWGGSGGAFKTLACVENTEGIWDGSVPFVHGTPISIPNNFTVQAHALRVLRPKMESIIDAIEPGGSDDMYAALNETEQAALTEATKFGFAPRAWFNYEGTAFGYTGVLASLLGLILSADPAYFEDFWEVPGYLGADEPEQFENARIHAETTIVGMAFPDNLKAMGFPLTLSSGQANNEIPAAFTFEQMPEGDLQGATLTMTSGEAAGTTAYVAGVFDSVVMLAYPPGYEALANVKKGDTVELDNSVYLAIQTYHHHQTMPDEYYVFDQYKDADGNPLYPQREFQTATMLSQGTASMSGEFSGKMVVVMSLMDEIAFPWGGDWYRSKVKAAHGEQFDDKYRLWYVDHAMHTPPVVYRNDTPPVITTQVISYTGVLQQALRDVAAWVEQGIAPPASTTYEVEDGQVLVPPTAAERKGVQPVVSLTANGDERADVTVGETVRFSAVIETPPGTGSVVDVEWDFEGTGEYPISEPLEDTERSRVEVETTYTFSEPGTYFPALRATSQRQGDAQTPHARLKNLGRVRVVVR